MADDYSTDRSLVEELGALRDHLAVGEGRLDTEWPEIDATRLRQLISMLPHLTGIIDALPFLIFAKDADGRFVLVNRAVAEAYGTTVDRLMGVRHRDVHPVQAEVDRKLADDREVIERLLRDGGVQRYAGHRRGYRQGRSAPGVSQPGPLARAARLLVASDTVLGGPRPGHVRHVLPGAAAAGR